ncbi:E3 ubiquitin-protein ligase WAV3-like [Curcuma longa]|uniref:E3 ubiquitin-protein ligase WAV3-like n=1 Tax=Curcuma longa TaxID=136217 RepID=UPI003D9DBE9A
MGGGSSTLRIAAKQCGISCASFCNVNDDALLFPHIKTISCSATSNRDDKVKVDVTEPKEVAAKSFCAICLEILAVAGGGDGEGSGQAIFTAQCGHAFHFPCIASNVRHGSVTCPICRAQWSQLPRESCAAAADPFLRILDHSIASSRVNRLSFLRSTRYNDDDPVDLRAADRTRLHFALVVPPCFSSLSPPLMPPPPALHHHRCHTEARRSASPLRAGNRRTAAYLSVKLAPQPPTDLVLVASPNGPHLRLLRQAMALVVFWMRPADRLAIVTHSTAPTRALPLRRMTAQGKRAALTAIDRLFYLGEAEPAEGLRKAVKILEERRHRNPLACILHLSDHPTRSYVCRDLLQAPIPVHRFHVGFGFGFRSGFVMHELEDLLGRLVGGAVMDAQVRVGVGVVRLGDMRGGEERRIALDWVADCGFTTVGYSYVEALGAEQAVRTGEVVVVAAAAVEAGEKTRRGEDNDDEWALIGGGSGCGEGGDYFDPLMARRWAKHLHGHKL